MTLQKFLLVALVIFFAGLGLLVSGVNRAPFRQINPQPQHQQGHSSSGLLQQPINESNEQQILAFK